MGQEGEKYILSLRRHLITTPGYEVTITLSVLFIILSAYLISWNIWKAILIFGLPYLVVNLIDYTMTKISRTYFPGRRIITLNLLVFIGVLVQIIVFRMFFNFDFSLFLAFSSSVFLRTFVYFVFMRKKPALGIITSLNYNTIYLIISLFSFPQYLVSFVAASVIYILAAIFILRISVAKFVREFSEDPLWFISSFINYLSNDAKEHISSLNKFFESIYIKRTVPVSSIVFWRGHSPKAVFLFPYIHPGPFGEVGGSDLTRKLRNFTGLDNIMVFHTTTTHDNNVADDRDVRKIAEVVKNSLKKQDRKKKMSDVRRFKIDGFEIFSQVLGNSVFVAFLPTRFIFDDVDLHAGLAIRKKLLNYYDDAVMVDAHNNFDEGAFPLTLKRSDVDMIVRKIMDLKADSPIVMGYSQRTFEGKSFGPDGIKVAVFIYKTKKIGYVLLDGNNIKKGLRNRIKNELGDLLDDVEVFSTDNHIVNYNILDLNPVGDKDNWENIVEKTRDAVKEALANVEPVETSVHTEMVEFRMARRGQLQTMTDMAKDALKTVKIAMPLIIVGSFVGALLSFLYL